MRRKRAQRARKRGAFVWPHRKSMRLKEMSPTKQAGGKGETEKGKQPACCTEEDGACLAEALYADAAIGAWGG